MEEIFKNCFSVVYLVLSSDDVTIGNGIMAVVSAVVVILDSIIEVERHPWLMVMVVVMMILK